MSRDNTHNVSGNTYGMLAEFATVDALLAAVQQLRAEKYHDIEAYTPFAVEGLADALGFRRNRVPLCTLLGGIVGGAGGYFLQWYSAVINYPINVGGRPTNSWPSFIPITFETTILGAAIVAVISMLWLNGLPKLYHPLFNVAEFNLASRNRFFVCVRNTHKHFDAQRIEDFFKTLHATNTWQVPT